ncbi:MAG TPA: M48 family metallopeptidase [Phycisphaerae bacterium]|nr:M48 family metallopeptidase [Phycisphaerae bacterium]
MSSSSTQAINTPSNVTGGRLSGDSLAEAFEGRIPRFRFRLFYGVGMLIVAIGMILLPLAYVGLIGFVAYGVCYHAITNGWLYTESHGSLRMKVLLAAIYVAPFAIGPLIVLFMLKPLFARRAHKHEPLTLDPSQEPVLYAVLERLCEVVGAPMPREIEVDCQLNAAAGFKPGLFNFLGRRMSLVLGMPLAAGLTVEEFIGVVAHELGHFSQGFGMRMSYIIRRINNWFARVVYERDAWDEQLADISRSIDFRFGLFLYIARACIWMTRVVLWILMYVGHLISCAFLRQMEYDADRVATDVVGAATYSRGMMRLQMLEAANAKVEYGMNAAWRDKRLPDNVPLYVASVEEELTSEQREKIESIAREERTGLVSTHPSLSRRLREVEKRGGAGVFHVDAPATTLFANFKMIANAVTLTNYRRGYGLDVSSDNLVPTEDIIRQQAQSSEEVSSSARFFGGCKHLYLPIAPVGELISAPAAPRESIVELKKLRAKFDAAAATHARMFEEYAGFQERLCELQVAEFLRQAGFRKLDMKAFGIPQSNDMAIIAARHEVMAKLDALAPKLNLMTETLRNRLTIALQLACVPAIASKLQMEEDPAVEIERLAPIVRRFEVHAASLPIIASNFSAAAALIRHAPKDADIDQTMPMFMPLLKRVIRETRSTIDGIRVSFEGVPYPFEHAGGAISVGHYLTCRPESELDFVDILMASNESMDKLVAVYSRCLGRLAFIAERVEQAIGLPPAEAGSASIGREEASEAS